MKQTYVEIMIKSTYSPKNNIDDNNDNPNKVNKGPDYGKIQMNR